MQTYPSRPPRLDAARPAKVVLGDKGDISCIIRNISARGACITPLSQYLSDNEFMLQDKFTHERWKARVIWRGVGRIGLELIGVTPSVVSAKHRSFGRR